MMQVALRGLWGRKLRTALTALSIILGTSMITGTFILREQINSAFSSIFHESNKGIDVVLSKKTVFTSDNGATAGPLPQSVIGQARAVDGVKRSEGQIQATGSIVVNGKYVTGSGGAPNLVFSYVDRAVFELAVLQRRPTVRGNRRGQPEARRRSAPQGRPACRDRHRQGRGAGHDLRHLQARRSVIHRRSDPGRAHVQRRPAVV